MAILLAVLAALCNALATIFERLGVENAPADAQLSWRLMAYVLKRPIWFLGLGAMVGAFAFQMSALAEGGLTVVQPLLATELLFLVVILRVWFGRPLGWREAAGTLSTVVGLAVFLAASNQGGGDHMPTTPEWIMVVGSCVLGVTLSSTLATRGSPAWRSAWFGVSSGIAFALCASFIKATTTLLSHGGVAHALTNFEPYGIALAGAAGLYLTQNAYHAGPVTASQATMLIVDPIGSVIIGVGVFGDNLRGGLGTLTLDACALALMSVGLFVLCHSPLIVGATGKERLSRADPVGDAAVSGAATTSQ